MIRYAIFDVDGCQTDGSVIYLDDSRRGRIFNVRDGEGIKALKQVGIHVWFVSGEDDECIFDRVDKLGVECMLGAPEKTRVFSELENPPYAEIAYMGDDLSDLECLKVVGMPGCPFDANISVQTLVQSRGGFVSPHDGGKGAVRWFCDLVLKLNEAKSERLL